MNNWRKRIFIFTDGLLVIRILCFFFFFFCKSIHRWKKRAAKWNHIHISLLCDVILAHKPKFNVNVWYVKHCLCTLIHTLEWAWSVLQCFSESLRINFNFYLIYTLKHILLQLGMVKWTFSFVWHSFFDGFFLVQIWPIVVDISDYCSIFE